MELTTPYQDAARCSEFWVLGQTYAAPVTSTQDAALARGLGAANG